MPEMEYFMEQKAAMSNERRSAIKSFEKSISYSFKDVSLLETALVHRSFTNENPTCALKDNERLEFLGDAVLGLCISDILMKTFPDYSEGQLSKARASVVNEQTLAAVARQINLGNYLSLGKGEEISGGKMKASILADAFEALTASIYLDGGLESVFTFIKKFFLPLIEERSKTAIHGDYKTALQEICQIRFREMPKYTLVKETGPDHDKFFEVVLTISDFISTFGKGKSKKEAEQQAAKEALKLLHTYEHTPVNKQEEQCP